MRFRNPTRAALLCFALGTIGLGQQIPNPDSDLTPLTRFDSSVLEFDFPGLLIGTGEYAEGPTGCTVFYFPQGASAVVDVRGGAPGTISTDILRRGYEGRFVSAITLAGGSAYGLETAAGVAAEILEMRGYSGYWDDIAVVPGAIIFDLQGRRFNTVYPDKKLARAALRSATEGRFYQGARGAGRFAMQGSYFGDRLYSGQGGAFRQSGPTRVAVFTVVNAVGTVVDRAGNVVRCSNRDNSNCGTIDEALRRRIPTSNPEPGEGLSRNTTITLVVTNQKLNNAQLRRLAVQVHTSMSRAIQPFHTETDGDTLFAASTGDVENPDLSPRDLGVLASETAWDAVLASVPALDERPRPPWIELLPDQLTPLQGRYEFGGGAELTIETEGSQIFARATGKRNIYGFSIGEKIEILPTSETDFYRRDPDSPLLRFDKESSGQVVGLTINPGHWPVKSAQVDH